MVAAPVGRGADRGAIAVEEGDGRAVGDRQMAAGQRDDIGTPMCMKIAA